jgi:hypothetical protein
MTTFTFNGRPFKLAPQTATVLRHLKNIGDISGVEAQAMYKVRSLTKRISEINDALYYNSLSGPEYPVAGQWSVDNTGQRYKRYVLPPELRVAITFKDAA